MNSGRIFDLGRVVYVSALGILFVGQVQSAMHYKFRSRSKGKVKLKVKDKLFKKLFADDKSLVRCSDVRFIISP